MTDEVGDPVTLTGAFTVAAVPDANRLTPTLQPGDGDVVGVGAPIVVRFDQEVTDRAAVEGRCPSRRLRRSSAVGTG